MTGEKRTVWERKSFYPKEQIFSEIKKSVGRSKPDYVTFVGDGEPTLCEDLGWLIDRAKNELDLPVAIITNGSLLHLKDVRRDLLGADIILPTLDAGTEKAFRHINRPHKKIVFSDMLGGLIDFRAEFAGQIWLEIMLVRGLNDSESAIWNISQVVDELNPDRVYLVTPIRPPAEAWVEPPSPLMILKAMQILRNAIPISGFEYGEFGWQGFSEAKQAIMEIGSRHPLRLEQALDIEKSFSMTGVVRELIESGILVEIAYNDNKYVIPRKFIRGSNTIEIAGG